MNFNIKINQILTETNWTNAIVNWKGLGSDFGEYVVTIDHGDSVDMEPTNKVAQSPTAPKTEYWLKKIPKETLRLGEYQQTTEVYPNDYNFDGDRGEDEGDGINPDVFDQMMQIVKIFQTYNNIDSAAEVEQKLKEVYNQWSGEVQAAVAFELMNMAQQGNPNWDYVANTILSIIVPSADDEADDEIPRR